MTVRHDHGASGPRRKVGVVVVAAGESLRMGGVDKVFLQLAGRPLVSHSLLEFENSTSVHAVALVLSDAALDRGQAMVSDMGLRKMVGVTAGGKRRQDSVRKGMDLLTDCGVLIIHDGARPFVNGGLIDRGLDAVSETGAATAAVPVKDTIKVAGADMRVTSTPDRGTLWAAQTPQVFDSSVLLDAHQRVTDDATDDASMVEALGAEVKLFMGLYQNIKVTTPEDAAIAEAIHRDMARRGRRS